MNYDIDTRGNETVIRLRGTLTFSDNEAFQELLSTIAERKVATVTFDLAGLDRVDSVGLGLFLIAKEECARFGAGLRLAGARDAVGRLLEIANMAAQFEIT